MGPIILFIALNIAIQITPDVPQDDSKTSNECRLVVKLIEYVKFAELNEIRELS